MSTLVMPEAKALAFFLNFHPPQSGIQVFSGFVHALKEARQLTHRDLYTGQKLPNSTGQYGSWLGAVGYFALLDQIGKCFKPKSVARQNGNAIQQALKHFTSLNNAEIDALYALRCAFAHDYSLYNIKSGKPKLTHNFIVGQGATPNVVTLPQTQWDGNLQNQAPTVKTTVSLEAFGDLVELVVHKILSCNLAGDLEILLPDGSDELVRRYMFMAPSV